MGRVGGPLQQIVQRFAPAYVAKFGRRGVVGGVEWSVNVNVFTRMYSVSERFCITQRNRIPRITAAHPSFLLARQ